MRRKERQQCSSGSIVEKEERVVNRKYEIEIAQERVE